MKWDFTKWKFTKIDFTKWDITKWDFPFNSLYQCIIKAKEENISLFQSNLEIL